MELHAPIHRPLERLTAGCSRCCQNLKYENFTSSIGRLSKNCPKSMQRVQHDYFSSFNQSYRWFVALSFLLLSSYILQAKWLSNREMIAETRNYIFWLRSRSCWRRSYLSFLLYHEDIVERLRTSLSKNWPRLKEVLYNWITTCSCGYREERKAKLFSGRYVTAEALQTARGRVLIPLPKTCPSEI